MCPIHMRNTTALHADINVTPLVDVCLVLLIIFMVVTPMMVTGMPVNLPRGATVEGVAQRPLTVTLNVDKTLYIATNVIRADQLAGELQRLRAESNRPVIVRAEKT